MKPFVKWAGGKTQLIPKLLALIQGRYETYYEPFLGGGALFLALEPEHAVLGDVNQQLVNVWKQLQNDYERVLKEVVTIEQETICQEYYIKIRERYNTCIKEQQTTPESAALFVWLNKHCFNGLYRVNKKGMFNVGYNGNSRAKTCEEENIRAIGTYLHDNDIRIVCSDFEEVCQDIGKGDLVYFDSPYVPVSKTASFTAYTLNGFSERDHIRLAETFKRVTEKGARAILSNNDVPYVYALYGKYTIYHTDAARNVCCKGDGRKGKEIIVVF